MLCGSRSLRSAGCTQEHTMIPVKWLYDQWYTFGSSASEENSWYGHSFWILPARIDYWTLLSRCTEPAEEGSAAATFMWFPVLATSTNAYRELGCAAGLPLALVQFSSPSHEVIFTSSGGRGRPSHQTPPSLVWATLVKIVFSNIVSMATWFVLLEVPKDVTRNEGHV